jgi:hypothetical protein
MGWVASVNVAGVPCIFGSEIFDEQSLARCLISAGSLSFIYTFDI